MKLLLMAALAFSATAMAAEKPAIPELKPEDYPFWQLVGSIPERKFAKATFSRATEEQFHVALEAVRAEVLKECARQTKEANEGGDHWLVSDHSPRSRDINENYQVLEMEQYHRDRKLTPFVVRTRMFGYAPDGAWAWTSNKYLRYLVYVGDDNRVLAIKKDDFSSVIDFYEWKLAVDEERAKKAKVLSPAGYSTELYEDRSETQSTSAE